MTRQGIGPFDEWTVETDSDSQTERTESRSQAFYRTQSFQVFALRQTAHLLRLPLFRPDGAEARHLILLQISCIQVVSVQDLEGH